MSTKKKVADCPECKEHDREYGLMVSAINEWRDYYKSLLERDAFLLRSANQTSAMLRHALQVIEGYREARATEMEQAAPKISGLHSPSGRIDWDDEQGWHRT